MRKRFIPGYYHRDLHHKLQTLTQGSMTVENYFKGMEMAMMRADVREDSETTMAQFLRGLRAEIADIVELQHYHDKGELLDKAIKVERRLKRRGTTRNYASTYTPNQRNFQPRGDDIVASHPTPPWPKQGVSINPRPNASTFDTRGASKPANETSKHRSRDTKCWKCQGVGHIANQCPNQRVMIMLPNGDIITDDEKEYEEMSPLTEDDGDESSEEGFLSINPLD